MREWWSCGGRGRKQGEGARWGGVKGVSLENGEMREAVFRGPTSERHKA